MGLSCHWAYGSYGSYGSAPVGSIHKNVHPYGGHKGQWPGEMQWVKKPNEDLRPEVLKRFGEDIEEIVPWDEGVFLGDSLLRAATTYLERAYYFDTSSRNIHVNYPDSFPDTETTHVDADGLLAIEKDWESPPKESKP